MYTMAQILSIVVIVTAIFAVTEAQIGPIDCPKPFEKYACGSACQTECATLGDTCPIVNFRCNDLCYCIDGYARDSHGVCIPIKKCPPKTSQPPRFRGTKPPFV